jgi:methionyl-tRNA formyltransferase
MQSKLDIYDSDTAGTLYVKLMGEGARLLVDTVKALAEDNIKEIPQASIDEQSLKHAPKIFKHDTLIDWDKDVLSIHNLVRGLSPYPAAYTTFQGKFLKIYSSHYVVENPNSVPGTMDTDGKTYIRFAARNGWLYITELQQEGKKRMDIVSFLRGFRN